MEKIKNFIFSEPIKFLKGGVVLKLISFTLNYILADLLQLNKELTYVFVLTVDLLIGYVINRYFVFNSDKNLSHKSVMIKFFAAGISFRALNWGIYVWIIKKFEVYILLSQLIATLIVLVFKFFVYKRIFR